jgi:hypothetical protein
VDNKNGEWQEVTSSMVSEDALSVNTFIPEDFKNAPDEVKQGFSLAYGLPRQGFDIPIKLMFNRMRCEGSSDKNINEWCDKAHDMASKKPPKRLLRWDKAQDRFVEAGRK